MREMVEQGLKDAQEVHEENLAALADARADLVAAQQAYNKIKVVAGESSDNLVAAQRMHALLPKRQPAAPAEPAE